MSTKVISTKTIYDADKRLWTGVQEDVETGPDISLGRKTLETLFKQPNQIAQICDNNGQQYANEAIATMSIRVAQHLLEMGLQQEDVIGICAANTDFLAPLAIGALLDGCILSTLDPTFDNDGIRHIFSISKPKVMFCDGNVYDKVSASLAGIKLDIPIFTMKNHLEGVRQIQELIAPTGTEKSFRVQPLRHGSQQTAAILCSSGTTGLPKGVCMSHESLLNTRIFVLSHADKMLSFSTLYWASGLLTLLTGCLWGCIRIITDQPYSPELFLNLVEKYKINIIFAPPSQLAMAVQSPDFKKRDLSCIELNICGGSAVPFAVIQVFKNQVKNCHVVVGYGMSEISGVACFGVPTKPGCNGELMPNIQVKVIDKSGNRLGVSETGEICIKMRFPWAGYYNNPEATAAIYHDGWLHSGDIGYFDENGSLFIVDRKKDILKYNNFHFFPTEIEQVIIEIPDVVEVCVCGIPDIISSFLPAAAVVKVPNSKLTEEDVSKYVAERMAHFKHLRGGVYFFDSIPKTASGKNIRTKITQIIEALRDQRS